MADAAMAYHEPDIVTILTLSSFLILANALDWALDRLLYCGLLGQIATGIVWGTPGAKWLSQDVQNTIMQIGYLGLILLVMEGGLSTDLKKLKSNLPLSCLVALVGVGAPIGLSFVLLGFVDGTTPVQAFAAGAALCSTSLGTTFTILSTSGLNASRLGIVLSSAAMLDDIVGLVMSGIISKLGQTSQGFQATTVIRPVFVSVAFAVILPVLCILLVKPLTNWIYNRLNRRGDSKIHRTLKTEYAAVTLQILVLGALTTAASYAGTSVLFAAYLAGATISWWDSFCKALRSEQSSAHDHSPQGGAITDSQQGEIEDPKKAKKKIPEAADPIQITNVTEHPKDETVASGLPKKLNPEETFDHLRGIQVFDKYLKPAMRTILKPFFFASIGFAIPITRMFSGAVLWRGLVYTILMIGAKLLCGLCLVRFASPVIPTKLVINLSPSRLFGHTLWPIQAEPSKPTDVAGGKRPAVPTRSTSTENQFRRTSGKTRVPKTISLYPAFMLGSAMVARGEIGFLISGVAETNGVFSSHIAGGSSDLYLIVTWAILLCTLIGPVAVGSMVKRVKRLAAIERQHSAGKTDPLGIWGMQGAKETCEEQS